MGKTGSMRNTQQRGIAIGPILAVVAILAVLASAIAAGSGAFNGDTSAVKAKAQATAILEYAEEVKFAVDRVLGKGCTDTEISFENPIVSGYTNPNSPSDKSCHVFDVNGGGIVWKNPPDNISEYGEYFYSGAHGFVGKSSPVGGPNPTQELALLLPDIPRNICEEINKLLSDGTSIINIGNVFGFVEQSKFNGTYRYGYTILNNLPFSICLKTNLTHYDPVANPRVETGEYHFYKVLIAH